MPDGRALPIAPRHRELTVKCGGEPVGREHHLLAASVTLAADRIAAARLVYMDGSAAGGGFALSDSDLFAPGAQVEIAAGAEQDAATLFKGLVVRHAIRVRDHSASQLVVECRHPAMKMALGRSSASYFDQSDSEVIEALLGEAGVSGEVEATTFKHQQLVRHRTSPWDFLLARARASGRLVLPRGDALAIKAPALGDAALTLQYGATVLELDAEIDARAQAAAVRAITWDPAQQALVEVDGSAPAFEGPGNLSPGDLAAAAGLERLELRHACLDEAEAQAWADASWLRSRMDKVAGRVKCEGVGAVAPGDTIELAGVGERFGGKVFVTGVRHEFDLVQGWRTHLQFGGLQPPPARGAEGEGASQEGAAGLLPRVNGLQVGVVVSNEDPDGEHRVRIRMPLVDADEGVWARVASPDAGDDRGFFFRPEVGDEVVAGFLDDDPRRAVILGMLHSSAKAAPLEGSDDNPQKLYKSREGLRLLFDDEQKVLTLDTPAGNALTLSEADKSIVIADQNGNTITLDADGVHIESAKAFEMKAGTEVKLESGTSFEAKGGTQLKLEGGTQAELSSSATTKVSGGMVQIN